MDEQMIGSRYIGYPEAARYMSVSVGQVRKLVADGLLTPRRIGEKLVRLDREQIDAYLHRGVGSFSEEAGRTSGEAAAGF
jgi:excisionase family DNA binding protein